ncbi:MAG: hypothetical protein GXP48_03780 [Acidobacteria bacterium]|nr:hypothetical protein [Acidobacteriota bacterium]
MRAVTVVAWYELKRNWPLFPGALLMGVLAWTAPLVPGLHQWDPETVREVAASVVAVALMAFASLILGSAILGGSVASGREGFFLARPVGAVPLWLGRMMAVLILSLAAPALVLVPLALARPGRMIALFCAPSPLALVLLLLPGAIAAAGLVRIMLKTRSVWLAALAAVVAGVYLVQLRLILRPLFRIALHADGVLRAGSFAVLPLIWSAAFLVGSAVAATRGRSDARRAASAGVGTVMVILLILTAVLTGAVYWVNAATPADITEVATLVPAPEGSWVLVAAQVRRAGVTLPVTFVLDTSSGVWWRWPGTWWQVVGNAPFSRNGRFVAWWDDRGANPGRLSAVVRVTALPKGVRGTPRTVRTVPAPTWVAPLGMALSPSGKMLATVFGGVLSVWNVRGTGRVTRIATGDGIVTWLRVSDSGDVWLGTRSGRTGAGRTMTITARHVAPTGHAWDVIWKEASVTYLSHVACDTPGRPANVVALAIAREDGQGRLVVMRFDAPGALWSAPLGTLWPVRQMIPFGATRIVVVSRRAPMAEAPLAPSVIACITREGVAWRRTIGKIGWAAVGPGPDPGTAVVIVNRHPGTRLAAPSCERLSLETGGMTPIGSNLVPAALSWLIPQLPTPGSPGTRVFVRNRRTLLRLTTSGRLVPVPIR